MKCAKTVLTQTARNTYEPRITVIVGATLLPMPREVAIVQSINALMVYEHPMILMRSMPAVMPSGSLAKNERNCLPNASSNPPKKQRQRQMNSSG